MIRFPFGSAPRNGIRPSIPGFGTRGWEALARGNQTGNRFSRVGVLAFSLLLVACSSPSVRMEEYGAWRTALYHDVIVPGETEVGLAEGSAGVINSMEVALQVAAGRDMRLARHLQAITEGVLGVESAGSLAWPRLGLEGNVEFPLDNDNNDVTGSGGLILRYSLNEAIFRGDAQTAADLRLHLASQRYREGLVDLYWDLREHFAEYACAGRRQERLAAATEVAKQAQGAAARLVETGRRDVALLSAWEARLTELGAKAEEAGLRRILAGERLRVYLGVSDFTELTSQALQGGLGEEARYLERISREHQLRQAWESNPAIREADLVAQLSEYEVVKAQRARLPRLSLRLGYGDIDVGNDEESRLVAGVGIDFPLFDMGDNRRLVKKALAGRDRARGELQTLARSLSATLAESRLELQIAESRRANAATSQLRAQAQHQKLQSLQRHGRADSFELALAEITLHETDAEHCEHQSAVIKALGKLNRVQGDVPEEVLYFLDRER